MKYEYCIDCGYPTGKAGIYDDSLYVDDDGPYCEECYVRELLWLNCKEIEKEWKTRIELY